MAKLCVVLATYNGEKYLSQMLDSLVAQTLQADKIIVVDDGSKDSTVEILRSYSSKLPLEIFVSPKNQGHRAAFSRALEMARSAFSGESADGYIVLADQDDIWLPQKHELLVKEIETPNSKGKLPDMVFGDAQVIDGENKLMGVSWRKMDGIPDKLSLRAIMTGFTNVTGCMVLFRASLLDCVLPIPVDVPVHDQWITFCAAARNGYRSIKDPVIQYRIHGQNAIGLGHSHTWTGNLKLNLQWAKMLKATPHYERLSEADKKFLNMYIRYVEKRLRKYILPGFLMWVARNASSLFPHVRGFFALLPRVIYGIVGAPFATKFLGKS